MAKLDNELREQGMMVFSKMPDGLLHRLKWFSEALEIPVWQVVHNLLIDQWARTAARAEVEGGFVHRLLPEFAKETLGDGTEGLVTGEALFKALVDFYVNEEKLKTQDEELEKRMRDLNEYKLSPRESVSIQELERRRARIKFLERFPDKKDLYDRAEARQKEHRAKRKHK